MGFSKAMWERVARDVLRNRDSGRSPACKCPQNALLAQFLRRMGEEVLDKDQSGDCKLQHTLRNAERSVANAEFYIQEKTSLLGLKHVGPKIAELVENSIWSLSPPPPLPDLVQEHAPGMEDSQEKQLRQSIVGEKRKKTYCPRIGSSNYAFLILLYKSYMDGEMHLTKDELMKRAEASGLCEKSVYGGNNSQDQHHAGHRNIFYNAWSSMKILKNHEPPLVVTWSNPLKIKITEDGRGLGKTLLEDAISRGTFAPVQDPRPCVQKAVPDVIKTSRTDWESIAQMHPSGSMIDPTLDATIRVESSPGPAVISLLDTPVRNECYISPSASASPVALPNRTHAVQADGTSSRCAAKS